MNVPARIFIVGLTRWPCGQQNAVSCKLLLFKLGFKRADAKRQRDPSTFKHQSVEAWQQTPKLRLELLRQLVQFRFYVDGI